MRTRSLAACSLGVLLAAVSLFSVLSQAQEVPVGPEEMALIQVAISPSFDDPGATEVATTPGPVSEFQSRAGIPLFDFLQGAPYARLVDAFANEPPVSVSACHYSINGGIPQVAEDPGTIQAVYDALVAITVYEQDGWGHTDDSLTYMFELVDGARVWFEFQGGALMGERMELYLLEGFDDLLLALPPA